MGRLAADGETAAWERANVMRVAELGLTVTALRATVETRASSRGADARAGEIERCTVQLYEKNAPGLGRYALAISGDAEIAQESVQEAFLRYYITLRKQGVIRDGRSWVYRTTRNLVLDRLKEYAFRHQVGLSAAFSVAEDGQDPEGPLVQQELLARAMEILTPREFDCLRLRREGLRYREIGEALGIDSGTVGALLARGLKKIRAAMGPERKGREQLIP